MHNVIHTTPYHDEQCFESDECTRQNMFTRDAAGISNMLSETSFTQKIVPKATGKRAFSFQEKFLKLNLDSFIWELCIDWLRITC